MKRLASAIIATVSALVLTTGAHAAGVRQQPLHTVRMGTTTFHLAVAGNPAKGSTFWLSYGPLAGRFGVIKLHPDGNHQYSARATLPLDAAGTFTYLQAQGTQMVHGLPQPGGIPTVIRSMEAVTAVAVSHHVVRWSVPLG
jgi:hypothetical protein